MMKKVKIKDVAECVNGKAFRATDWTDRGLPIIRIQNLNSPDAPFNHCNKSVEEKYHVHDGSLLFAWSGTPGTSFGAHIWTGGEALLNQHIFQLKFDRNLIAPRFFLYQLNLLVDEFIANAHGSSGLAHITKKKFEEFAFNLPTLFDQERLIAKMDVAFEKLDAAIERIEHNLKDVEALFEALLQDTFRTMNMEKIKLSEVVGFVGGGTPSRTNSSFWGGSISWATVKDMNVPLLSATQESITEEGLKNSAANLVPRGSLVIATRVGLGKVCKVGCDYLAINQDLKGILPKEKVDAGFLFYWFQSIARSIQSQGTGATVKGVKMDFIKNLLVPLPNLEVQNKVVSKLNKASLTTAALETRLHEQLCALQALKKSILHAAFNGDL